MKNPLIAFILGFFPGAGLLYLGKVLRGLVYMLGEFFLIGTTIFIAFVGAFPPAVMTVVLGVILYLISLIDTAITASKEYPKARNGHEQNGAAGTETDRRTREQERFYTIVLSFVPGLGHFQLGLMNRGMTILAAFLGLGIMVIFVAALTGRGRFSYSWPCSRSFGCTASLMPCSSSAKRKRRRTRRPLHFGRF